jgi:hypothetical protein
MSERAEPSADKCRGPEDLGQLFHDKESDIWYECVFDNRKRVYTWTILPPEDVLPRSYQLSRLTEMTSSSYVETHTSTGSV